MKPASISMEALQALGAGPLAGPMHGELFAKILIANRGEIACRIAHTARRLGIATVAVYSEADRGARHVALADEAVCIGPAPAVGSYLDVHRILDACRRTGAEAVHPGYGFLSENAAFARMVEEEGLVFIGPGHQAIAAMGDKIAAKRMALQAGLDVIPGWNEPVESAAEALKRARQVGYPVMLKASAGGGGRGLRIAHDDVALVECLQACRREAAASFGDDRVFIERLVEGAHHVEVQVLADHHGACIHLWERECSVQRRHQKLLEEAPSPVLDEATRTALCRQAVTLASAAGYRNAGTVEFLVDAKQRFFFLEMNTRLQVEHPVTECITGLDLVEWMIRIAAGQRLPFEQHRIQRRGCAIECRINADDPARNFLPSAGRLVRLRTPAQSMQAAEPVPAEGGVRLDSGVHEGDVITTHYDSMIGKLIVHAPTRAACIRRMRTALDELTIRGVCSNVGFLADLMAEPEFQAGRCDTGFVGRRYANGFKPTVRPDVMHLMLAIAVAAHARRLQREKEISGQVPGLASMAAQSLAVAAAAAECPALALPMQMSARIEGDIVHVGLDGCAYPVRMRADPHDVALRGDIGGASFAAQIERIGTAWHISHQGSQLRVQIMSPRIAQLQAVVPATLPQVRPRQLMSPMAGRLVEVPVSRGQRVCAGERLAVIEAMKMENVLMADEDGVIADVFVQNGDNVAADQRILSFD